MRIKAVVHVVVDVEYDVDDAKKSLEDIAKENVTRPISHLRSVIGSGQMQGEAGAFGAKFGIAARDEPTVTCIMLDPQERLL